MNAFEYFLKAATTDYANFTGRSRRSEYWFFRLISALIMVGWLLFAGLVLPIFMSIQGEDGGSGFLGLAMIFIPLVIFALALFIPSIAVTVRRLHDTGNSGWFLLFYLIPYLGSLVILVFMIIDGQQRTNKWGPDPKGRRRLDDDYDDLSDHLVNEDDLV